MLIADTKKLNDEIERIYAEHYAGANDKTVHDIFNAIRKRIRRYTVNAYPTISGIKFRRVPANPSEWLCQVKISVPIVKRHWYVNFRIPIELLNGEYMSVEVQDGKYNAK